jgi:hypothetical protein
MPQLYVANATKQIVNFAYRSLERPGVVVQPIYIGGQICVAPNGTNTDLTTNEIDYIIDQHRHYGIVDIDELSSLKGKFYGIVFQIGSPIDSEKLQRAMIRLEDSLNADGKRLRQEAAVAVNSQIENQIGAPLRQLEMSFQEVEPRGGYTDDTHVAEGVRVSRTEQGRRGRR